jgi:hypothetical protein
MPPWAWSELRPLHLRQCGVEIGRASEIAARYAKVRAARGPGDDAIRRRIPETPGYLLEPNAFPYWLQGCAHWVFWSVRSHTMAEAMDISTAALGPRELIITENAPQLRSVPTITHYHVFARSPSGDV